MLAARDARCQGCALPGMLAAGGSLSTIKQHHLQAPWPSLLSASSPGGAPAWGKHQQPRSACFARWLRESRSTGLGWHRVKGVGPAPSRVATIRKDVRAEFFHPGERKSSGRAYCNISGCKESLKGRGRDVLHGQRVTRGKNIKLKEETFKSDVRKKFLTMMSRH